MLFIRRVTFTILNNIVRTDCSNIVLLECKSRRYIL